MARTELLTDRNREVQPHALGTNQLLGFDGFVASKIVPKRPDPLEHMLGTRKALYVRVAAGHGVDGRFPRNRGE